ncbi:MAG: glycosyltransferase [Candidatus Dojkabacteria bacterium]
MKISVITSTYNRKDFLIECISSVQKTILLPLRNEVQFEHIIYDDGSTDGTEKIFENHNYINLKFIRNTDNHGQAYGRNRAVEAATGEYLFVLDSDDILLQRTLFNFADIARKNPDTLWFVSDFLRVDDQLRYLPGQDYFGWNFKNVEEILNAIFKGEHYIQHNVFFKKELFLKSGGYDEKMHMAEDLDVFVKFLLNKSFPIYTNFLSHLHRTHLSNLSKDMNLEVHKKDAQVLFEKYKNR